MTHAQITALGVAFVESYTKPSFESSLVLQAAVEVHQLKQIVEALRQRADEHAHCDVAAELRWLADSMINGTWPKKEEEQQ